MWTYKLIMILFYLFGFVLMGLLVYYGKQKRFSLVPSVLAGFILSLWLFGYEPLNVEQEIMTIEAERKLVVVTTIFEGGVLLPIRPVLYNSYCEINQQNADSIIRIEKLKGEDARRNLLKIKKLIR